ncbi:MAG: penicillin-insensitive murein endopeptidase [Candidatus Competibacteraceae bacterium]|nr:penicillin-insensitive murein endopeptidase [Candidatus Competibacteraceae bacterium]MBK8751195.1 penicillin-insensitive murein endopeptidase [Candidatus Competibacteraceae bacterium]
MSIRSTALPLFLLLGSMPVLAGNGWSEVAYPLAGPSQVIGSYAAGCITGAVALPLVGDGYQIMRTSRNRYYGHPALIGFVEQLGRQTAAHGSRLLIGDLAQPRGGPMPNGHRSHQSGLDVDIWFLQQPRNQTLSRSDTEQIEMPSMIRATEGALNDSRWSSRYRDTLKRAAQAPEVERIFVNAIIKQALCDSETDRSWLEKVRPWWGHDAHFHVRLNCPADSGQCKPQKPFPPGDGCDADLANWVRDIRQAALSPKPYRKPEPPAANRLPTACSAVLYNPTASRQ